MNHRLHLLFLCLGLAACGGGDSFENHLAAPSQIAADSLNRRLLVFDEGLSALSVLDTSTNEVQTEDPLVSEDVNASLAASVTASPLDLVAIPSPTDETVTRVFATGTIVDGAGELLSNRIAVFDIAGTTPAASSFSPIIVSDNDDATDDSDFVLSSLAVDEANDRLFVLNKTLGELFIFSTGDGTEDANSPIALNGTPSRMAIDPDLRRLFIASAADDAAGQIVTTISLDGLSTTEIPVTEPLRDIGVVTNETGTVFAGIVSDESRLVIYRLDTGTFTTATELFSVTHSLETSASDDGSGEETLITASVADLAVMRDTADQVFVYAAQSDGNILVARLSADLSELTSFALETGNELMQGIAVLEDSDTGDARVVYVASPFDGLIVSAVVGDETDFSRIR